MALPVFEASARHLGLESVPVGGGVPVGGVLPFRMQRQLQTQWCWAAVTASTATYYNLAGWTQCRVANTELQQSGCCVSGNSPACNRPYYLDKALSETRNFAGVTSGRLTLQQVGAEIDAGRPIGVRIGWGGGGGHFVVVNGYSRPGTLQVSDPWFGPSSTDYLTFSTRYQGFGSWTHAYRTTGKGAPHADSTKGAACQCIPVGRPST